MQEDTSRFFATRVLSISLLAITLLIGFSATAGEEPIVLSPNAGPVPLSFFCLNILFHPLTKVPWPAVPFGSWRLSHTNWADLEPQKDNWYFTLLDRYADWGQEHHTEILMPLAYTPQWASSAPDARTDVEANAPPGLSGPPRDMEDWKNFVRTVATRYKGRIHVFEIWNEPNRPQSWVGDVDTMITMTQEAREILKEIDPHNIVVAPAPEQEKGLPWLDEFLRKGGARYVDVVAYHFYVGQKPPESIVPLIQHVRSAMAEYHTGERPLWNTEAGWLGPNELPPDLAAAYVARAYILNWASGVSRFYWFAWEIHSGTTIELTEKDNATLTSAGRAYATIEQWMIGKTIDGCLSSSDGTWSCGLVKDGKQIHIVWSTTGNRMTVIPEFWGATTLKTLSGVESPIQNGNAAIGAQPILIQ
jgi:Glycosyl hydrolase catalytic core